MEIRLLGPFEVVADGRVVAVPRGRVRSLLATLALAAGRPVGVDALMDRLWDGDGTPQSVRQSLQNNVWRLRGVLGSDVVTAVGDGYLLEVAPDQVDVLRFGRLLDRAAALDDLQEVRGLLGAALELWRGAEPLAGVQSESLRRDWIPALTEQRLAAVERCCDIDLAAGRSPAGLVAELREWTARHPVRDSLWARLLIALWSAGREAEALETYDQVRRLLADRLGAEPSAELRELHRRLLAGQPLTERRPPEPPADTTVARPAESTGVAEPAGVTSRGRRTAGAARQLPPQVTGFVGRDRELGDLIELVREQQGGYVVTVVVHGAAGMGKTALATRWAHQVADRFPDGQFFLDLRGYGPGEPMPAREALSALLRSLGADVRQLPDDVAELAGQWRTALAGRRVLMLLDNARDAGQLRPLLPGSNALVVVTSRSRLRGMSSRDGARLFPLPELTGDEARRLLAGAIGADRVARERDAAAELIALCGGSPLALRIAADLAVRRGELPLRELAAELRTHRLDALADPDDPTADPRAVISWSYRSLTGDLARVFRLLSLHPGAEVSGSAAAAVIGETTSAAGRLLDRLAGVHLLEEPRPGRYRMHDLVREYAAERTEVEDSAAERDAAVRRLLDWYLLTANSTNAVTRLDSVKQIQPSQDVELPVPRFADAAAAMAWWRDERTNLVPVTRLAAATGNHSHAWQVPWASTAYCELLGWSEEWLAMAEIGYRSAAASDQRARYLAAYTLGSVLDEVGRRPEAEKYKLEALEHARASGQPARVASTLNALGCVYDNMGDCASARRVWEEGQAIAGEHDLTLYLAHIRLNLGDCEFRHGDVEVGLHHTGAALEAYRELGAPVLQGIAWSGLAEGHTRAGRPERAVECADQAMAAFQLAEEMPAHAQSLVSIGRAYAEAGQPERARPVLRRVVETAQGPSSRWLADAEQLLARIGA